MVRFRRSIVMREIRISFVLSLFLNPSYEFTRLDLTMTCMFQLVSDAEELHDTVQATAGVVSDLGSGVSALNQALQDRHWTVNSASDWWKELNQACGANKNAVQVK